MRQLLLFAIVIGLSFSQFLAAQSGLKTIQQGKVIPLNEDETLTIQSASYFDISKPLREMDPLDNTAVRTWKKGIVKNGFRYKLGNGPTSPVNDPTWQKQQGGKAVMAPIVNVEGTNNGDNTSGVAPPDTQGDVGPNHYVQMVNNVTEIFNKSGVSIWGPQPSSTFWSGFTGSWTGTNDGDPIVLYDQQADRWFVSQFAVNTTDGTQWELIAISQTADPTGSYYRYAYQFTDMPDYPKIGIWPDGYYMSANRFTVSGGSFNGTYAAAFDRTSMLAGISTAQMILKSNGTLTSDPYSMLPSDCDGSFPPVGTPNYFCFDNDDDTYWTSDRLKVWAFTADWTTPSNSSFVSNATLVPTVFNSSFTSSSAIAQPAAVSQGLDPLADRMMFRAQYRTFSGHQSIVLCRTVNLGSDHAGMRWYELRNTGSGWSIYQEGTYGPDSHSRWMGSIAMNSSGDISLGYSVSSSSVYPSIRYTGRLSGDVLGSMTISEGSIFSGTAGQSGVSRWGDYSMMSVDPVDDHTFWYTTEYSSGSWNWRTRIASFQLSVPSNPPVANFVADNTMPANASSPVNFTNLTTGSTPLTYSWSFSPSSVTYTGSTTNTSQNPSVLFNNPGAYTVTLTATHSTLGSDSEIKTAYIHMGTPGLWTGGTTGNQTDWDTPKNWENHMVPTSTTHVQILSSASFWPTKTGNLSIGTDCSGLSMGIGYVELTVTGDLTINSGKTFYVDPTGMPNIYVGGDWIGSGTFTPGQSTVLMNGSNNSTISGASSTMNIFYDGFEGANSWTLSGEFEMGAPNGLGGNYGYADPSSAYLGTNVLGVDLTGLGSNAGDYEASLSDRAYQAISPTINCLGFTNVSMNFQRWLGVESPTYDHAYIDISIDNGSTWTQIWTNTALIEESSWGLQNIDISSYADNQAQVNIMFSIGISDGLWQYCGWNIDEFNISGDGSSNAVFNNLSIEKTNAKVSSSNSVDVLNDFTIKPAAQFTNSLGNTLNVMGNTAFEADASGMASFIDNGTSTFLIDPVVQQFLTNNKWHFVGIPVVGALSGVYTGIYLRGFDEASDSWGGNILATDSVLSNSMGGYAAWAVSNPATVVFNGPLKNGPYNIPVTKQSTGSNSGWNLVANPYPSSLDWDGSGWSKSDIDNTIYYYSGSTGMSNYYYYVGSGTAPYVAANNGSREIPPHQGFFVHATAANGTLSVNNNARIHSGQAFYKENTKEDIPLIRINAEGEGLTDETVVRFFNEAISEFDSDFDAYKLFANEYPQVYTTTIMGTELAVNTLPEIVDDLVVPVSFSAPSEDIYNFTFTELVGFDQVGDLYLEDVLAGELVEVDENTIYTFQYSAEHVNGRFFLHFGNSVGVDDYSEIQEATIYAYNKTVYVRKPLNFDGSVQIFDILGQELIKIDDAGEGIMSIPVNNGTGYYLVKVKSEQTIVTKKVFIK